MGKGSIKISFPTGIPPFSIIKNAFLKQTGLHLLLVANLSISSLTSDTEQITLLLQKDLQLLLKLKDEYNTTHEVFLQNQDYKAVNANRSQFELETKGLNKLDYISLEIVGFYSIHFYTKGDLLEVEWYIDQHYGIISLEKVLIDLGGQIINSDGSTTTSYPDTWKRLRKWENYKWYNRPRK